MAKEDQSIRLLVDQEVDSQLLAAPFFWRQMASEKAGAEWIWGYATTEYDMEEDGSVSVILLFRGNGESSPLPSVRGFEIYEGDAVTVGDWDGDGKNELIAVDIDGQLRVFEFEGRPVEGIVTGPTSAKIVHRKPVILARGGNGGPLLAFLSVGASMIDAACVLAVYHAPGQSLPGFPLELDPPSVSSLVKASTPAGLGSLAFVREDGSICAYDLSLKILDQIAQVKPDLAHHTVIAAADVDSDGEDEILFASGGDSIISLRLTEAGPVRTSLIQQTGSAFVALASGRKRDCGPVVSLYDQSERQFGFFCDGQVTWASPCEINPAHTLVSLSEGPVVGSRGSVFVAVFYDPSGATEVLLFDSKGDVIDGTPIQWSGLCPFIDGDESMVLAPAVLYEPSQSRLLLLTGLCGSEGDQPSRVCMHEIKGVQGA